MNVRIIANVHHGEHRATVTREVDLYQATEDEARIIIGDALEDIRDNPQEGVGYYLPTARANINVIAEAVRRDGEAANGWVRVTAEEA